ncbi:MAG TPA: hypothetical protein VE871_18705, partial [Longimicrobium sp.]|nr:hypothetical protein [Longimicrobium sp.]
VVEQRTVTGTTVCDAVAATLRREAARRKRDALIPVSIDPAEAFASAQQLGRAVRILCRAQVAVFDVTPPPTPETLGGEPSLTPAGEKPTPSGDGGASLSAEAMVLLGIRSVARRSLTVLTSRFLEGTQEPAQEDAPFYVPLLPFLIRDVSVYGWGKENNFVNRLRRVFDAGLERAERIGTLYRDLPAYEEVRRLGPDPAHFREQGPDKAVLLLAPFAAEYRGINGDWLVSRVASVAEGQTMYIVQSDSPERTAAKLYAAIRRTQFCVVDWTGQSPNVFYELGVRLAASRIPPFNTIHRSDAWARTTEGIVRLLAPLVYDHAAGGPGDTAFESRLSSFADALREGTGASWMSGGAGISPGFVYRQMEASIAPESEDWSVPVWKELVSAAEQVIGRDPDQEPEFRGVYGNNPRYRGGAEESARDRLLAAWYYLDQRYGLTEGLDEVTTEVRLDSAPWSDWFDIGTVLVRELAQDPRADCTAIREKIRAVLRRAEDREMNGPP